MLRGFFAVLSLCVLMLGVTTAVSAQDLNLTDWEPVDGFARAGGASDDDGGNNGLGFGKKIAGAWLCSGCFVFPGTEDFVDCENPGEGAVAIPAVQTNLYGADGTLSGVNPDNPNSYQGTWKKTGSRQIVDTTILYLPDPTFGVLVARIPAITDFDEDFQNATVRFSAKVYLPGADPLDPTAWSFQSQGLNECRKVNASAEDLFNTTP